ncbi:RING finger protein [Aphelenchoides avenae]|nr:RING finger protein [Aphelenchus avenae]
MLEWLCCNLCTRFSDENGASPFYVTSCMHIACNICVTKGKMSPVCGYCKKSAPMKRIDELTGDASLLFEDPLVAIKKINEEAAQAVNFQKRQELSLINKLRREKDDANRKLIEKEEQLAASAMNTSSRSNNTTAASGSRPTLRRSVLAEPFEESLRENAASSRHPNTTIETPRNVNTSRGSYGYETTAAAGSSGASASKSTSSLQMLRNAGNPTAATTETPRNINTSRGSNGYETPATAGSSGASASKSTSSLQMIRNAGKKSLFNVVPLSTKSVRADFGDREKRQLRDPVQARGNRSVTLPLRHNPYGNVTQRARSKPRFV